ncbi:MAG: hypothetical protein ACK5LS_06970 [Propioniciclava sp.]
MIVHEAVDTAALDPQIVWDRWTRIECWPVDSPNIARARLNGPVAQGALGWIKPTRGPRVSFRIADADRMAGHFAIEAKMFLGTLIIERELERAEVNAAGQQEWTLTHRVTFRGLLARVWNRVVGRDLSSTLPGVLANVMAVAAL